jgi:hypothetical protein
LERLIVYVCEYTADGKSLWHVRDTPRVAMCTWGLPENQRQSNIRTKSMAVCPMCLEVASATPGDTNRARQMGKRTKRQSRKGV